MKTLFTFFRKKYFLPAYIAFIGLSLSNIALAADQQAPAAQQSQTPVQTPEKTSTSSFSALSRLYLPSLPDENLIEEESVVQIDSDQKKTKESAFVVKIQPAPKKLSQREVMATLYEIFARTDSRLPSKSQLLQNNNLFEELNIFCGSKNHPEHSLFSHMFEDKINTSFGKIILQDMIFTPSKGVEEIKEKQVAIKYLLDHPKEMEGLDKLLRHIGSLEETLVAFYKKLEKEAELFFGNPYFGESKILNKQFFLECKAWIDRIIAPLLLLLTIVFCEGFYALISCGLIALILAPIFYMMFLQSYGNLKNNMAATDIIHKKMSNVARFVCASENIGQLFQTSCDKTGDFLTNRASKLGQIFSDKRLNRLLSMLKAKTFTVNPKFFTRKGNILEANLLVKNGIKGSFIEYFKAIGEVDAILAIAKLMKESEGREKGKYCFAEFVNNGRPSIDLKAAWNPMLDPNVAVANDIQMGGTTNTRCFVTTGPNAGGKTTNLKTIILSALLGSRLGIVPENDGVEIDEVQSDGTIIKRKVVRMSYISLFATYLGVMDEAGFASLFEAQIHCAAHLFDTVEKLDKNEYFMILGDEIMTGTNPYEGGAAAYAIIKIFVEKYANGLTLFTTHYEETNDVEKETNGLCANMKVRAEPNPENNPVKPYVYPYKLEQGISHQRIALDLIEAEHVIPQAVVDAARAKLREMELRRAGAVA